MNFSEFCHKIIPGYPIDTDAANEFEASEIGQQFSQLAHKYYLETCNIEHKYATFFSIFYSTKKLMEQLDLENNFHSEIETFLGSARGDEHYIHIISKIKLPLVLEEIPDLRYLSAAEQLTVSKNLCFKKTDEWQRMLNTSNDLFAIRQKIYKAKKQHALEEFQVRNQVKQDYIHQFKARFKHFDAFNRESDWQKECALILNNDSLFLGSSEFKDSFERVVTKLIQNYLYSHAKKYIDSFDLEEISLAFSKELSKFLIGSFQGSQEINIDGWKDQYQKKLFEHLMEKFKLINDRVWKPFKKVELDRSTGSLSQLFSQNKTVENARNFINKIANTHAFIQSTGFASQNESSYLAMIDVYNYGRFHEVVEEQRNIILSFLSPFRPIYFEYKNLAEHEKNIYMKIIGTVMPMIIAVAFTILVASLLNYLAIAEAAFIIALIPTIYLGLCVAAEYIKYKDYVVNRFNVFWHGGVFEIPQFQANKRVKNIFPDSGVINSDKVRRLYIDEIKKCDALELALAPKAKAGVLSSNELEKRQSNLKDRHILVLEWYDIHSNNELGCDLVREIVINRIEKIETVEYENLCNELDNHASVRLKEAINNYVNSATQGLLPEPSPVNNLDNISRHPLATFFKPSDKVNEMKQALKRVDDFRLAL